MELKNKYSKQIIYSNQKFEDQIWYNQQIMTFLNFSQLPESVFRPNFPENTFLKTKPNSSLTGKCFSLNGKCFPLTNFSEDKQTQESLESGFPESEFRETNGALKSLMTLFLYQFGVYFFLKEMEKMNRKIIRWENRIYGLGYKKEKQWWQKNYLIIFNTITTN